MDSLDDTNLRLIEHLQADARATMADLARAVRRSETTVRDRVHAMERRGLLRAYRAEVDLERLGLDTMAWVRLGCDPRRLDDVRRHLDATPSVTQAWYTTGEHPLLLQIVARDIHRLEEVLQMRIAPLELGPMDTQVTLEPVIAPRPPSPQALLRDDNGGGLGAAAHLSLRSM